MAFQPFPGERILKKGPANLQRGLETVGGSVVLTNLRVYFDSHAVNIQTGASEVRLADIADVTLGKSRFLGAIPLTPNAVVIHTTSGEEFRLTVYGRAKWKAAIDAARH